VTAFIADSTGFNLTVGDFRRTATADTIVAAIIGSVVLSVVGAIVRLVVPDRSGALRRAAGASGRRYVTDLPSWPDPRPRSAPSRSVATPVLGQGQRRAGRHRGRREHGFGANVVSRGEWAAAPGRGAERPITLEDRQDRRRPPAAVRGRGRPAAPLDRDRVADEAAALASIADRRPGTRLDVLYRLNPTSPETGALPLEPGPSSA
jgi:hypothetical protein